MNNFFFYKSAYSGCFPIYARIPPSTYSICPFTAFEAAANVAACKLIGLEPSAAGVLAQMNESNGMP